MVRLRSILPLILALFATFLVSCGSGVAQAPPTYTPEKVAQIETALIPIKQAQEKLPKLAQLIADQDWIDVRNFIHGPMGLLRRNMSYVSRQLLEKDQGPANELAKEVFADFDSLDLAAKEQSLVATSESFYEIVEDFEEFLQFVPTN
ncbi:MAG: photosystem II protein PsbQ [Spirulinaceae cyanobacterium]